MIKCDRCGTDTTAWTELEWTEYVGTRRGTIYGDSGWHNRVCVPCYKVIGDDVERAIASAISDSLWDAADDPQGQELAEWLEEYGPDSGAQPDITAALLRIGDPEEPGRYRGLDHPFGGMKTDRQ